MTENSAFPAPAAHPGHALRVLRTEKGWTLQDVSNRTGLPISTLSKVEHGKMALTYDKITRISQGLGIEVDALFVSEKGAAVAEAADLPRGRRSVSRAGEGALLESKVYRSIYPATDFLHKQLVPIITEVKARTLAEFGPLLRHSGEEYSYVVEGAIDLCTSLYAPLRLEAGDSIYFDSSMAHAYIAAAPGRCRLVTVCSADSAALRDELEAAPQFAGAEVRLITPMSAPSQPPIAGSRAPASARATGAANADPLDSSGAARTATGIATAKGARPGEVLKALRTERGWTLQNVCDQTGLPISTLSKIEHGKMSLTYDKITRLSRGLKIDILSLFVVDGRQAAPPTSPSSGRRSVIRRGEGMVLEADVYNSVYPASDLLGKKLVPIITDVKVRRRADFGALLRHSGEEYLYVVEGAIELHTDLYTPLRLEVGDSVYFDSSTAHAYIAAAPGRCLLMTVCSASSEDLWNEIEAAPQFAESARRLAKATI